MQSTAFYYVLSRDAFLLAKPTYLYVYLRFACQSMSSRFAVIKRRASTAILFSDELKNNFLQAKQFAEKFIRMIFVRLSKICFQEAVYGPMFFES